MSYTMPVVTVNIPDLNFLVIVAIFETLFCGLSNAIYSVIYWRHYRPTCSEMLILFYISLYARFD